MEINNVFCVYCCTHVAVNNIKVIFKFAQKSFYGEFYLASNNKIYLDLHVICPKSCPILTSFGVTQKIFIQTSFVEFHWNPSSRRADSYRQTEGWTDGRAWRSYWTIFISCTEHNTYWYSFVITNKVNEDTLRFLSADTSGVSTDISLSPQ